MSSVFKALSKKDAKADTASEVSASRAAKKGYRHRHLMNDLLALMPHAKKDVKFDRKGKLQELNELAELYSCNNVCYFEARKGKDLYMYQTISPNGPTVKYHVQNMSSMDELNFPGNNLKGSRPLLSFDRAFDDPSQPHLQIIKALMTYQLGTPMGARKAKPFVDHVTSFSFLDGKIWVRNYEIKETESTGEEGVDAEKTVGKGGKSLTTSLVEIGPRFTLQPIVILESSFGGPVIYESKEYVSPNFIRAEQRRAKSTKHSARAEQLVERQAKRANLNLRSKDGKPAAQDELDTKALFA
ncbi:Ribosome biogenesis protein BRX1 [Colletotrichum sidae]|uniref:Ribosome biogenesis protein BRX1 n=2 Tax=Colletotrichum orbiculare species complex TaxID=2707354 RepID=A0A4R8Q7Y3_9PEZI|nr:Ribosome biogenesis protein BRX1 [Colletotrichum spinosum]TEA22702.1 Ribosome biogenesis protein BRX1 [Colletotrichum sidae]